MSEANSEDSNRESPPSDVAVKQDELRVQCLLAEIELLKRTISELQFQVQTTQCSTADLAGSLEEAAVDAVANQSDFQWVEPVRMYYHASSGFYFDDVSCLFYNPTEGCYLKYNPRTSQYVAIDNSKCEPVTESAKIETSDVECEINTDNGIKEEPPENPVDENAVVSGYVYDRSSGYFYNSASQMFFEPLSRRYFKYDAVTQTHIEVSEHGHALMQKYLPEKICDITDSCVRLIVIQSELEELPRGSLFVVTKNESKPWIGHDKSCAVVVPNTGNDIEPFHCKMKLNEAEQCWQIRTGKESFEATVNGKILSADWTMLSHGMLLVVGSVTFSVHIHSGDCSDTCDGCEPALVRAFYHRVTSAKRKSEENDDEVAEKQFSVEEKRRMINKMMKQEMGLQAKGGATSMGGYYKDRAAERRAVVGSEPSIGYSSGGTHHLTPSSNANAAASSVDMPVRRDNIGYKLLAKMGYRDGEGLGLNSQGIVEPVTMEIREQRAGLSESQPKFSLDDQEKAEKYKRQWSKAAKRFAEIS